MLSKSTKYLAHFLFLCMLCYAWVILVVFNGDLLYTAQDFSPWLGTEGYFMQAISHPGGLREWAGDWLTQLFYYPWLGGSVMVLMWTLSAVLLSKACRLQHGYSLLALIPVAALLTSMTQMGYWIFCLKTPSYWFGSTVGFLAISLAAFAYSRLGHVGRCILLCLWVGCGFPLLGWMATLGFGVLLLLTPLRQSWQRWGGLLGPALVAGMIVLSIYSNSMDVHWRQSLLLYGFPHVAIPEASSQLLEVAPTVFSISLLAMPLISRMQRWLVMQRLGLMLSALLLATALFFANMLHYRNVNFHTELSMLRAMDEGRWDDLLLTMKQIEGKPTREMVMMKDVALAQKGRLAEEAFRYDIRGTRPVMNSTLPIHMAHSAAPTMYYWLGLPNYTYMWSMENSIEYGLSPHWLRLFYRCAVVNGEQELAKKYKRLLSSTLFHQDLEVSEEECQAVRRFISNHNELTNDEGFSEIFLMNRLCNEQYAEAEAQEIALHYALLMRQPDKFAAGLDHYVELIGQDKPLPVHYQEALLLFAANLSENAKDVMDSLPVSDEVRKSFELYRNAAGMTLQQIPSAEKAGEKLYSRFGHTYWWYYDFYTNNKTY